HAQALLGASLAGQSKFADAEPLITAGYEGMLQRQATMTVADRRALQEAGSRIVSMYAAWEKPARAKEWTQKLAAVTVARQ
ncbi:MAG TPA: hypothetical protein VFA04_20530, partial [Bryobacteraceae bacterium]|nr:hypothetical protein [Bryobacteraceae bacterium]